ncbi:palmitoyltransferase ZDHHC3 [Sarcoptes scabiei]|nr:palmitoyltransferase ZDHHC3 [Sarcoptes scabiei]
MINLAVIFFVPNSSCHLIEPKSILLVFERTNEKTKIKQSDQNNFHYIIQRVTILIIRIDFYDSDFLVFRDLIENGNSSSLIWEFFPLSKKSKMHRARNKRKKS